MHEWFTEEVCGPYSSITGGSLPLKINLKKHLVCIKIHPKQSVLNYFDKSIPLNKYFHIHFDKFTFTINEYFHSR